MAFAHMSSKRVEEELSCVSTKSNLWRILLYVNYTSINLIFLENLPIVEREITVGTGFQIPFGVLIHILYIEIETNWLFISVYLHFKTLIANSLLPV